MADISMTLELDDQQFKGKLKSVKAEIEGLKSSASGGGDLGSNIGGSFIAGGAAAAITAGLAAITAGVLAFKSAVTAGMEVENLRIRLDALTGSSATGAAALDLANQAALRLPYSLGDISKGIANLVNVSPTLDKLNERIQLTADIAAVSGLPFDVAAQQIQRALSSGIASADLFRERGVTAMLGFRNGVEYSIEDSKARIESWGEANKGVADKLNNTLGGALSQLSDQLTRLKQAFADAVNPALTAVFQKIAQSMQDSTKASQGLAFELGVKFVEAGIAVAKVIAMMIDNVKGFYQTFEPVFSFAGKLLTIFAEIAVRAFGAVNMVIGDFGMAIGKLTDFFKITNNLTGAMENLRKNGTEQLTGGLEAFKKQLDEGKLAIFGNAQQITSARDTVDEYAKSIRGAVEESRKKREEDAKGVKTLPSSTPIGTPTDTNASKEAQKQIDLLREKLKQQRESLQLGERVANQSEIARSIAEATLKLEGERDTALISARATKDIVDRNFITAKTTDLYREQIDAIRALTLAKYESEQGAKLDVLYKEQKKASEEFVQSLHDQFSITIAGSETEKRLLENKIKLRQEEQGQIQKIIDKYGEEKLLAEDIIAVRDRELARVRKIYEEKKKVTDDSIKSDQDQRESFSTGWKEAFNKFKSDAENSALAAKAVFSSVTKGLEDLIVNFVTTGKLNFKDFANSIIADFVRIQARKIIASALGGSGTQDFFSMLTGKASGGPVIGNTPYLVGENGPELFVPRTSGNIVPNGAMGGSTQVTYNISAVDATSFRQMLAREPEFLYAVTEKGRSSIPAGRR
jgi:lambda family phage tail tape measure protein